MFRIEAVHPPRSTGRTQFGLGVLGVGQEPLEMTMTDPVGLA